MSDSRGEHCTAGVESLNRKLLLDTGKKRGRHKNSLTSGFARVGDQKNFGLLTGMKKFQGVLAAANECLYGMSSEIRFQDDKVSAVAVAPVRRVYIARGGRSEQREEERAKDGKRRKRLDIGR